MWMIYHVDIISQLAGTGHNIKLVQSIEVTCTLQNCLFLFKYLLFQHRLT